MLTSFFSKSKPINFVVVAAYMIFFYVIAGWEFFSGASLVTVLKESGVLLLFILSSVIIDFIAKRNEITSRNAYKTILFAAFTCMLLTALRSNDVIIANFFVLLAMRRIMSLRSQKETEKKIFDATLWIGVASLFYFWAILFLGAVFYGILLHVGHRIKNWLVPVIAYVVLISLVTSINLLLNDSFYTFNQWYQENNFDFSAYRNTVLLIPVSFLFALTLWSLIPYIGIVQRASPSLKASLLIVLFDLFIGIGIAVLAPTKNGSELIFFLTPLAIIVTNYFQLLNDKWFREIILFVVIALPAVLVFFL